MKVKKRSGLLEEFNLEKIKTSIARASDDARKPLTNSDVDNLAHRIKKGLEEIKKEIVSSKEIFRIVVAKLDEDGFKSVTEYYKMGSNK